MTDLFAARSQMAVSLGFHILFAVVGMAMPLLMVIAEGMWLRTREAMWLELAKRWAKGTAVMFAVGAVSGTVLSFELGLLWPEFMAFAGSIIGMPFSLEGFAFFFEAIFLGIWLYGWNRISPLAHWLSGVVVAISGAASGAFVLTANAWMNAPTGFTLDETGAVASIDPIAAMLNPNSATVVAHMLCASYVSVAFVAMAIHGWMLLRSPDSDFHRRAFSVALGVGIVSAILQPVTGHFSAERIAHTQPMKLAAAEAQWETQRGAPLRLGGIPDSEAEVTRYAIEIPKLLSLIAFMDPNAEVMGLKEVPPEDRPPVEVVHIAFEIMIFCGVAMAAYAVVGLALWVKRRRVPMDRWFLKLAILTGPLGLIAIEAGWTVTEVGRQPWIIYGLMRTEDAVTPMPGLVVTFTAFTLLYIFLGVTALLLLRRQVLHSPEADRAAA